MAANEQSSARMRTRLLAAALLGAGLAPGAGAAMPGLYFAGFYMDSSLAYATTDAKVEGFDALTVDVWAALEGTAVPTDGEITDKTDIGFSLGFGYRFNDYLAAELGYVDMGSVKYRSAGSVTFEDGTYPAHTYIRAKNRGPMVAGIVSWPLGDYFALDARSGLWFGKSKVRADIYESQSYIGALTGSYSKTSLLLSAGLNWSMAPGTAIRVGYSRFGKAMMKEYDVSAWTLSLKYAW